MTLVDDTKISMQSLSDMGLPIIEVSNEIHPDFPIYIIKADNGANIQVGYSSYNKVYSFSLYKPVFGYLIEWRQQEELLIKAGLVAPQKMHKPCKRRFATNIAYQARAHEILLEYYERRVLEREAEVKEIESVGGKRVSSLHCEAPKFKYIAKSKLFTLEYNFEGFAYTSKSIIFNKYESRDKEVDLFKRFKDAGF
jgi:hypothetical protein